MGRRRITFRSYVWIGLIDMDWCDKCNVTVTRNMQMVTLILQNFCHIFCTFHRIVKVSAFLFEIFFTVWVFTSIETNSQRRFFNPLLFSCTLILVSPVVPKFSKSLNVFKSVSGEQTTKNGPFYQVRGRTYRYVSY